MAWYRMDLHLHTPASADYQDLSATYIELLRHAEERGLNIVAFTDHNSVSGIAAMRREIEDLELLEELDRLTPAESNILEEYRRLLAKILVLPGFELTAAYGFHILALFAPETTVRRLEHLLMTLGVPEEQMESGSGQVGATADVLTAYEMIHESGGLVIPAHVNAAHGIAMPGFRFGEQTKIAYTQSEYVHALEVTDLDDTTRRATASFFNGSKPAYPRRMHCIQGSDAHRLAREGAHRDTDLGIGDRATEVLLPERSFGALKALLISEDFARIRPYQPAVTAPLDAIQAAREQGPNIAQSFHEQARSRRSRYRPITKDIVAFANTNGGTIYIGVTANPAQAVAGVPNAEEAARGLGDAIARSVVPKLDVAIEIASSAGKPVLVVTVPKGLTTPYATDAGQVFVRQDGQTVVALRDEIVQLVREAVGAEEAPATTRTSERVWTAPRHAADEDDELDDATDAPTPERLDQPPPQTVPETVEERRAPRRRRSRRQSPPEHIETPASAAEPAPETMAVPPTTGAEPAGSQPVSPPVEDGTGAETPAPRPRRRRRPAASAAAASVPESRTDAAAPAPTGTTADETRHERGDRATLPTTGIEILAVEERDGERYYTMRDLRSGRTVNPMSRKSARRLWRQAIMERERGLPEPAAITWNGALGYWGSSERDGVRRHNLAVRDGGEIRYFYAVSDEGLGEAWQTLVPVAEG